MESLGENQRWQVATLLRKVKRSIYNNNLIFNVIYIRGMTQQPKYSLSQICLVFHYVVERDFLVIITESLTNIC
jgi:hypothetical protein